MMKNENNPVKLPVLKALIIIIDWNKAKILTSLLQDMGVPLHYQVRAEGTASNETLDILGLAQTEKMLTLSISAESSITNVINKINREGILSAKGGGIAFTMPLSGVGSSIFKMLSEEAKQCAMAQLESEVRKVTNEHSHELIIAAVNHGYSEELMEKAKEAGARGGTVVHARRVGFNDTMKFMGISVQAEKEIIAILTEKANKVPIMRVICDNYGMKSEAQGMVLSLPVDTVAGIE